MTEATKGDRYPSRTLISVFPDQGPLLEPRLRMETMTGGVLGPSTTYGER